jgi:hypothetical protein
LAGKQDSNLFGSPWHALLGNPAIVRTIMSRHRPFNFGTTGGYTGLV